MHSIFRMPSDDLAGAAQAARAATKKEEGKCAAFSGCLPATWQVPRKRRRPLPQKDRRMRKC